MIVLYFRGKELLAASCDHSMFATNSFATFINLTDNFDKKNMYMWDLDEKLSSINSLVET